MGKPFSTQFLSLNCEAPELAVAQQKAPFTELLAEDGVLRFKVLNRVVLFAIHPAGDGQNCQMPRSKKPFHAETPSPWWKEADHPARGQRNQPIQSQARSGREILISWAKILDRVFLPYAFVAKKRGGQTQIHLPAGTQQAVHTLSPAIATAMARAWKWRQWFGNGEVNSLAEAAKREGCTEAYVRKLLPMAFLAPDLIEAGIQGTLPRHLKIADLARQDMPLAWDAQRRLLGTVVSKPNLAKA